jgi:hypothetical protein
LVSARRRCSGEREDGEEEEREAAGMTVAVVLERRRLAGRTKKSAMVLGAVGEDGAMGVHPAADEGSIWLGRQFARREERRRGRKWVAASLGARGGGTFGRHGRPPPPRSGLFLRENWAFVFVTIHQPRMGHELEYGPEFRSRAPNGNMQISFLRHLLDQNILSKKNT